jgi:hypothetical protein
MGNEDEENDYAVGSTLSETVMIYFQIQAMHSREWGKEDHETLRQRIGKNVSVLNEFKSVVIGRDGTI